jgi:hypothetical protein
MVASPSFSEAAKRAALRDGIPRCLGIPPDSDVSPNQKRLRDALDRARGTWTAPESAHTHDGGDRAPKPFPLQCTPPAIQTRSRSSRSEVPTRSEWSGCTYHRTYTTRCLNAGAERRRPRSGQPSPRETKHFSWGRFLRDSLLRLGKSVFPHKDS